MSQLRVVVDVLVDVSVVEVVDVEDVVTVLGWVSGLNKM